MVEDALLEQINSMIRKESRRRMTQIVWMVSFFSWLVLLNIYQSLLWAQGIPPSPGEWIFAILVEAFFAIVLASLTLGAAHAISHLWRWSEKIEPPEIMKELENDRK